MGSLRQLVKDVDWEIGLKAWKQVFTFKNHIKARPDIIPDTFGAPQLSSIIHKPKKGENWGKKSHRQKRKERKERKLAAKTKSKQQNEGTENNIDNNTNITNINVQEKEVDIAEIENCEETEERNVDLTKIHEPVSDIKKTNQEHIESSSAEPQSKKAKLTEYNPDYPSFRVTCHRTGNHHSFDSMGAASNFGSAVYNYFKWNVSMKDFDMEVMLYIDDCDVRVGLALTKQSLHRRNTTAFGRTTLRPTIAYNMLRMCNIQPGEVICDPMCGSGVIPVQAAIEWPQSIHICGEIQKKSLENTIQNIKFVNDIQTEKQKPSIKVGTMRWDVRNLPLRDSSVDVFITDLPFGVRSGSKTENKALYPKALQEMTRVTRPTTGRACLLTQDKRGITMAMQMVSRYWKRTNAVGINMGGLAAGVYMMYRNSEVFDKSLQLVSPDTMETTTCSPTKLQDASEYTEQI